MSDLPPGYTFSHIPDRDSQKDVSSSMEMDGLRAQMAPSASDLRKRALAAKAATNGHHPGTHHVLGSEGDE